MSWRRREWILIKPQGSSYRGDSVLDDADESGEENDDGFCDENGDDVVVDEDDSSTADNDAPDTNCQSLIFMFDCETTGLSVYEDHITELAAEMLVPSGVSISTTVGTKWCVYQHHQILLSLLYCSTHP